MLYLVNPVYAQTDDQLQAEKECQQLGNKQSCRELISWANRYCRQGNTEACDYVAKTRRVMQSIDRSSGVNSVGICDIYPTRCGRPAQGRTGPIYTPEQLAPGYGSAVRGGLDAMPRHWRNSRYPRSVRDSVRDGTVDRGIERSLGNGVDPYLNNINGYGPGGAGHLNEAAKRTMDGSLTPECIAIQANGGRC